MAITILTLSLAQWQCLYTAKAVYIQFNDPIREQSGKRASKKGLGFSWKDARSWIIRRGYYDVMGGWRGGGGGGYQGGQQETWTNKVIHSDHHCCFNDIYRVIIQKTPKCLCGKTWWKCVAAIWKIKLIVLDLLYNIWLVRAEYVLVSNGQDMVSGIASVLSRRQ